MRTSNYILLVVFIVLAVINATRGDWTNSTVNVFGVWLTIHNILAISTQKRIDLTNKRLDIQSERIDNIINNR